MLMVVAVLLLLRSSAGGVRWCVVVWGGAVICVVCDCGNGGAMWLVCVVVWSVWMWE